MLMPVLSTTRVPAPLDRGTEIYRPSRDDNGHCRTSTRCKYLNFTSCAPYFCITRLLFTFLTIRPRGCSFLIEASLEYCQPRSTASASLCHFVTRPHRRDVWHIFHHSQPFSSTNITTNNSSHSSSSTTILLNTTSPSPSHFLSNRQLPISSREPTFNPQFHFPQLNLLTFISMSNPANFQPQIPSTVRGPWVHTFVPPASRMSCFNSSTHTCGCGCVKTKVKGPTCVWPPWPTRATSPPPFCGVPVSPGGYRCVGSGIQQLGNQGGPIIINNGPVPTGGHLHQGQGCGHGGIASAFIYVAHL